MSITENNNEVPALIESCCGMCFNEPSQRIINSVFVDDSYIKKEAVSWIYKNLKNYKFVGKEAKDLKKRIENVGEVKVYNDEVDKILSEFFAMFANNPFCAESGICILQKSYIIGKNLNCYFVVYKRGVVVPFGALELFVHDNIKYLRNEFVGTTSRFASASQKKANASFEEMEERFKNIKSIRMASYLRFALGLITFVLSLVYVISCIAAIDWVNIAYYSDHAVDIFQALRFAAEEGFNISHNSDLSLTLLGLGVFWLVHLLIRNIKFIKEFKNAQKATKLKSVIKSLKPVLRDMDSVKKTIDDGDEFVNNNFDSFPKIFIKPNFDEKKFGTRVNKVGANRNIDYDKSMSRVLPKTLTLIISTCLIISTLAFGSNCKNNEVYKAKVMSDARDKQYKEMVYNLSYVESYLTTTDADVYTKAYPESLVIYHLDAGSKCTVLDSDSSEEYTKISFLCDEGVFEGWISKDALKIYHPKQDKTLYKKAPFSSYASSSLVDDGYVPSNTVDGSLNTVWQEGADGGGAGEWIRYDFDGESTQISSIGIYSGDARSQKHYYNNGRPVEIAIVFYNGGDVVTETLNYVCEDEVFEMQYINLNKPVEVTSVEIQLVDVVEGTYFSDACISEVEFYCVNPEVQ